MGMLALWNTSAEGCCCGADVFFFKCNLHPSKVITCHKRNDSWRKRWRSSSSELRKWNDEDTWKEWELNSNRVKKDILSMRWEKKTGNKMSTYSKLTKQKIQHLLLRLEGTSKEFDHPSWIWLPILVSLVQHTSVYFFSSSLLYATHLHYSTSMMKMMLIQCSCSAQCKCKASEKRGCCFYTHIRTSFHT